MCRPTQTNNNSLVRPSAAGPLPTSSSAPLPRRRPDIRIRLSFPQVLERLQQRLQEQLQLSGAPLNLCSADHLAHVASRGSGPRIFCGHVPPVSRA